MKSLHYNSDSVAQDRGLGNLESGCINARPNLIIIKTTLEAASSYASCSRTVFLPVPTPRRGGWGEELPPEQLHAHPRTLRLRPPARSTGAIVLRRGKNGTCSCHRALQPKGYSGGKCSGFPKAGLRGCGVCFQSRISAMWLINVNGNHVVKTLCSALKMYPCMSVFFSRRNYQKQTLWAVFLNKAFQYYMLINQQFSRLDLLSFHPTPSPLSILSLTLILYRVIVAYRFCRHCLEEDNCSISGTGLQIVWKAIMVL